MELFAVGTIIIQNTPTNLNLQVVEFLASWQDRFGRCGNVTNWRERGMLGIFEGCEIFVLDLKLLFFKSLFQWINVSNLFSFAKLRCLMPVLLVLTVGVPIVHSTWLVLNEIFTYKKIPIYLDIERRD